MNISTAFLSSRFGRRVFFLFFVAALIPVGLSALVSYTQVGRVLGDQSIETLRDDARSYGLLLIEKLTLADALLATLDNEISDMSQALEANRDLAPWFKSVVLVRDGNATGPLLGTPPTDAMLRGALAIDVSPGKSGIFVSQDRRAGGRIFLVRSVGNEAGTADRLIAELGSRYLWDDPSSFPESVDFCAVSDAGVVLKCSRPVPANILSSLRTLSQSSSNRTLDWQSNHQFFVGSDWHLFINSRFEGEDWIVLAFQQQRVAFAALVGFNSLYLKVALLALVMVAFLSSIQIRRSLSPLQVLLAGTSRIAARDFSSLIEVKSGDEFEHLAESMNNMSDRLKRQFHALAVLGKVDRMILSSIGLEPVLESVMREIRTVVPCDALMLAVVDRDAGDFLQVYAQEADESGEVLSRVPITSDQKTHLEALEGHSLLTAPTRNLEPVRALFERGATSVVVFPILRGKGASGFIALGYEQTIVPDNSDLQPAADFADRIAVAMSSVEHEDSLYHQAHYDFLTGLPNRQLFIDRLGQELSYARRDNRLGALMFIDLDNFKRLNDSLGHSVGDELLKVASRRLQLCVRDADTVARLGGDEFTVIISGIPSASTASNIADLILEKFSEPFLIGKIEQLMTASIGITLFPDDGTDAEKLLKNADTAMYRAKSEGRARKAFFEDGMHKAAMRRLEIEVELRNAVANGQEFRLQYQPQINIATGKLAGAEALVRWKHPERGLVPPDEFVTIAEECGVIHELGLWVLRRAVQQFSAWQIQGLDAGRICVNVSTRQFEDSAFASCVRTVLLESELSAHQLEIEITESLLVDGRDAVANNLAELQRIGVRLAVDDFGTGYSSLSYLRKFRFETLKIDRAFISGLPESSELSGITNAIVQMAHALGKNVVAEGIERLQELAFLKAIGCDEAQGYYLARPLEPEAFEEFMQESHTPPVDINKAS